MGKRFVSTPDLQARKPARLEGGAIIRAVYSADLYSIVLRGPDGESIRDDLTLRLIGWRSRTIERPDPEPPILALRVYRGPDDTPPNEPAPCPMARDAAERWTRRRAAYAVIPVTGPRWLDGIGTGSIVDGHLYVEDGGHWSELGQLLELAGHVTPTGAPIAQTATHHRAA